MDSMSADAGKRRARDSDSTADRLAVAALHLFDRQGFAATTIDDIAAAANVSRRTFFRHFPRKEAVILFEQAAIHDGFRKRFENRRAGVSVLDEFIGGVPTLLREAGRDPERLKLRVKLIRTIPELAWTERDADGVTIEIFAAVYAEELGGRPEDRVRAVAVGSAVVAAANAALAESIEGGDALLLFEAAADAIRGWAPVALTRPAVAIVQVPAALTDGQVAELIRAALVAGESNPRAKAPARR
jgi:AcrR family transcriptional regulator